MCIVIDANSLSSVFDPKNADHANFKPVFDWIIRGNGKIIFGGTKYFKELKKVRKVLKIFNELKKKGKIVVLDTNLVDVKTKEVDVRIMEIPQQNKDKKLDDPHLVAIVVISGCKLVCTLDLGAIVLLKILNFYPKGISPPKIYTGRRNENLLCDQNIVEVCKPKKRLNKKEQRRFS